MSLTDPAWFRTHLAEDLLPRWRAAAVTSTGLFLPDLDREWRRKGGDSGTLVSQARLAFDFAAGWRLTGHPDYRAAAADGARFLLDHFRDPEHGGYYWEVGLDGRVVSDRKDSYGQAFTLFGLAHAHRATGDERFRRAAVEQWQTIRARLQEPDGGLLDSAARDFTSLSLTRSQNPVMHYFEALLALGEHEGEAVLADAGRVARFITQDLVRPADGALPEVYDDAWQPLPTESGGRIDVGHQFEWAWLLSEAERLRVPGGDWLASAHRLLDVGLRLGYDPEQGGIFSPATLEGEVRSRAKGWWEQCEAARAMLRFTRRHGRRDLAEPLVATLRLLRERFADPAFGGWFMRLEPDGTVANTDKGNVWKVDYHVVGMCLEGMSEQG